MRPLYLLLTGLVVLVLVCAFFWLQHQAVSSHRSESEKLLVQTPPPAPTPSVPPSPSQNATESAPVARPTSPDAGTGLKYTYNARGELQQISYPDGTVYTYVYDQNGNKVRETDRGGRTWTYLYDSNGHPIQTIDPQGRRVQLDQHETTQR